MPDRAVRAEDKSVIKVPLALVGVFVSLLTLAGTMVWTNGVASAKFEALTESVADLKKEVREMSRNQFTDRDAVIFGARIEDHEARLRKLENQRSDRNEVHR